MLHGEGIAGLVFLILYSCNLTILSFGFLTHRIKLASVYFWLLFHVVLRLAAQSVAIALGSRQPLDAGLLIAFFVLGAEGYFSLVLCTYRFLIHHHQRLYPVDGSWLEGKPPVKKKKEEVNGRGEGKDSGGWVDGLTTFGKRFVRAMTARDRDGNKDPWVMTIIHWVLIGVSFIIPCSYKNDHSHFSPIPYLTLCRLNRAQSSPQANVIIINGGTRVNASDYGDVDFWSAMNTARILRATGQAIFLTINLFLAAFLYLTIRQDRSVDGALPRGWTRFFRVKPEHGMIDATNRRNRDVDDPSASGRVDPLVKLLVVAWPPLIIRGIFGLLQSLVPAVNYSNPAAYASFNGFTKTFIVCENVLAVLPEWTACCLLCATIFTKNAGDAREAEKSERDAEGGRTGLRDEEAAGGWVRMGERKASRVSEGKGYDAGEDSPGTEEGLRR